MSDGAVVPLILVVDDPSTFDPGLLALDDAGVLLVPKELFDN